MLVNRSDIHRRPALMWRFCPSQHTLIPTHIGATAVGTGGDWSPNFQVGDQQCVGPQLLGRSYQKARNFTALSRVVTRMQDSI